MRALITGAAGFIGSHVLRYFHMKTNWELLILDRLNYAATLDRLEEFRNNDRVTFVLHDLRAPLGDFVVKRLGQLDYVFHLAAETHVDRSMVEPEVFVQSNVIGTFNLLEYCRLSQPGLKMFFYISTDEVYGPAKPGVDHDEHQPHRPSNPYSAAKAGGEDLVYAWEHSMGVPTIITNTMNNIGEMQHPEKYVPKIIRALWNNETITVHGSPDQPGSRKYLHALDHADALFFLTQSGRRGERYNVVGREEINNLELLRRIEHLLRKDYGWTKEAKIKFVDFHSTRPGHDFRYALDGSKMAGLGWLPKIDLNEALSRCIRHIMENPQWGLS